VTLTTDNGTQFTSSRFLETLGRLGITHRRTAYHHPEGNSYIERFHRSLKEEEVWTAEYRSLEESRASISRWIEEYNHDRLLHRGVQNRTPHEAFLAFAAVLNSEKPQPQKAADTRPAFNPVRKRILVIDDGDSVRDVIRIFLEHAGFDVCGEAADGVQAIEQAKTLKPDLIVLDLKMPRMNGAEAASVLSTTLPGVPIVLLTLYRNVIGTATASAVGVKAIIDKTDGLDKLVKCVRSLLVVESAPDSAD
jgi:CheY-like chemotaxis protein